MENKNLNSRLASGGVTHGGRKQNIEIVRSKGTSGQMKWEVEGGQEGKSQVKTSIDHEWGGTSRGKSKRTKLDLGQNKKRLSKLLKNPNRRMISTNVALSFQSYILV